MADEPELEYPDPDHARPPEQTWRILFLDRLEKVDLLKETCKERGYVVVGAETIAEAMACLEGKDHVDVIVCAAHLETGSMFTFLEKVRGNPQHSSTVFLILSLEPTAVGARLDRSAARAGMALGADAYLIMPIFDSGALLTQIRELQPAVPLLQTVSVTERLRSE